MSHIDSTRPSFYSLGDAAKATGKHKTTIAQAIKRGRISVLDKTEEGYRIDPAELHRVYPMVTDDRGEETVADDNTEDVAGQGDTQSLKQALTFARLQLETEQTERKREVEILRAQLEAVQAAASKREKELEDDRRKWHEQAEKITLLLQDHRSEAQKQKERQEAELKNVKKKRWFF